MKTRIYTDGACSENPGPGGWAAVFNTHTGCKMLLGHEVETTNNRMELTAMVKSMEKVNKSGRAGNQYEFYSDSAYVVNSINNGWVEVWRGNGWKTTRHEDIKNRDLWERFWEAQSSCIQKGIEIKIIKVKGHSGNPFNEYADRLAKEEVNKARKERGYQV